MRNIFTLEWWKHFYANSDARRAVFTEQQRWGLLPPQKRGTGLLLLLLILVSIAVIIVFTVLNGWSTLVLLPLSLVTSVSSIALNRHTNEWLDEQAAAKNLRAS